MPLTAPILDDRHFQDIVDEAKKRIPQYCKEWTDHNVSDPGITLVELFAWMADLMLYRYNQVPERHYIKFMELLGIKLQEPVPAQVPVTFWLSAPQPTVLTIPAGTQVASTQTETERSIIFTTDQDFEVTPPRLQAVLSRVIPRDSRERVLKEQVLRRLEVGFEGFDIFSSSPQVDDALFLGFENDLSHHILGFEMELDPAGGAGIDPTLPPYTWETYSGKGDIRWQTCEVDMDTTRGLNSPGRILIHVPEMSRYRVGEKELYWVRVRVKDISPDDQKEGMRPYRISPRLKKLAVASWGGTIPSTHAQKITREFLGRSDGSPGQRYQLQHTPLLPRKPEEKIIVEVEGDTERNWKEAPDFSSSGPDDRHYVLEPITGEVRFGPAVRQPDGTMKLYGSIPPRHANILMESYRYGGGQEGNVQTGVINTLKTSIPFIARVSNRIPAWGGLDPESLEAAKMRVPAILRSRDRAVTESDFEFLARQALPAGIGRVKCLQPRPAEAGRIVPGQIYLLVIPRIPYPTGYLDPDKLKLRDEDIKILETYLDERRLLTTRLDIRPPAYHWIAVRVKLHSAPGVSKTKIEAQVKARLYRFLNPLVGGFDGTGWEFGRDLFISDVYQCLQGIPDVQFVRSVEMFAAKPGEGAQGAAIESQEVIAHGVIASGLHEVVFV
jgi:predicted phage baseplate assembly protein